MKNGGKEKAVINELIRGLNYYDRCHDEETGVSGKKESMFRYLVKYMVLISAWAVGDMVKQQMKVNEAKRTRCKSDNGSDNGCQTQRLALRLAVATYKSGS